jgi:hypothetical protein
MIGVTGSKVLSIFASVRSLDAAPLFSRNENGKTLSRQDYALMSCPQAMWLGDGMALIFCYIIAYVQIMSAGFNLWGVDPRILLTMPFGRNTMLVGMFLLTQLLGLLGAVLILQKMRLGFILSILHHVLLLPALLVTSWGLVMLMDDRINVTLLFMSGPSGSDIGFYWSLGWSSVFQQVTPNVPSGSTYIGINLFAYACATVLWLAMDETDGAKAEREMRMRRRQRRPPLALPPPQSYPQEPRMRPHQGARQQPRMPPRREREYQW